VAGPAAAQKKAMPGVTDTEIKIGQTMPYKRSGVGLRRDRQGRARLLQDVQREGGINGRKVTLMSLDDGYSPPKAVEQVRKLVEQEKVAVVFHSVARRSTPRSSPISTR